MGHTACTESQCLYSTAIHLLYSIAITLLPLWAFMACYGINFILNYFYCKTKKMHQYIKFILFWNYTIRVSDGLSIHHQEFKTVHTATGICQTIEITLRCTALWTSNFTFYVCPWSHLAAVVQLGILGLSASVSDAPWCIPGVRLHSQIL